MSQVIILVPNGRRQSVKVTPNTTMLEIIEEVCKKHELPPEEHDLRHHRSILTASSTIRFCGIPQNAHLELIPAQIRRRETNVTLCLQLESGARIQGDCLPFESLWTAMTRIAPETAQITNPVIIYMRREVAGKEALENTTLRTIGLTDGRAIIRVLNRTIEELRSQAHVSVPLPRPPPAPESDEDIDTIVTTEKSFEKILSTGSSSNTLSDIQLVIEKQKTEKMDFETETESAGKKTLQSKGDFAIVLEAAQIKDIPLSLSGSNFKAETDATDTKAVQSKKDFAIVPEAAQIKDNSLSVTEISKLQKVKDVPMEAEKSAKRGRPEEHTVSSTVPDVPSLVEKVILLGDRNAIAYSLDSATPSEPEDLPDDFFELTLEDVRSLYKARRKAVEDLNSAPLLTAEQRKLDKDGLILQKLGQYKSCIIRIRLPDRTVLQGCFKPFDTILMVHDFVKEYLADSTLNFYLYTTPPKEILKPDLQLIEADFVPSANLYLGLHTAPADPTAPFLRPDVVDKFSTVVSASRLAAAEAGAPVAKPAQVEKTVKVTPTSSTVRSQGSSSSTGSPPQKVPKWLKLGK